MARQTVTLKAMAPCTVVVDMTLGQVESIDIDLLRADAKATFIHGSAGEEEALAIMRGEGIHTVYPNVIE